MMRVAELVSGNTLLKQNQEVKPRSIFLQMARHRQVVNPFIHENEIPDKPSVRESA